MDVEFLPRPEVERVTTHSRAEIHRRVRDGRMPAPIRLSRNRVAWIRTEIENYLRTLIAASRGDGGLR